jgi:hypothetical protein
MSKKNRFFSEHLVDLENFKEISKKITKFTFFEYSELFTSLYKSFLDPKNLKKIRHLFIPHFDSKGLL